MRDLNDLFDPGTGFTVANAYAINEFGQITGHGSNSAGQTHAYLLTPYYLEVFYRGIREFSHTGETFTVRIDGFASHSYQLQRTSSLNSESWENVGSAVVAVAGRASDFF